MEFIEPAHPLLRRPVKSVLVNHIPDVSVQEACDEMIEFATGMTVPDRHGGRLVGLAAPQVGIDYAIALVDLATPTGWSGEMRVLINPRIVRAWGDQTVKWWHGCYSTGDLVTIAELPQFMEVEYYDRTGVKHTWVIDGVVDGPRLLHVVWHEIRHVWGLRHPDHAVQMRTPIFVLPPEERMPFHEIFLATGKALCPRTLQAEGWEAMKLGWGWRNFIVEAEAS